MKNSKIDLSTVDVSRVHIFRKGAENPLMVLTIAEQAVDLRARLKASYSSVLTVNCLGLDGSLGQLDVVVSEISAIIEEPFDLQEALQQQAQREAQANASDIRRSLAVPSAMAPMLVPGRRKAT